MRARKKDTCGTSEGLNKTIDSHPSVYKMGIIIGSTSSTVHQCSVVALKTSARDGEDAGYTGDTEREIILTV